jgi:hypothetical protein
MKVVGWIATGVLAGVVLAAAVAGASSANDIKRYLRMRQM